VRNILAGPHIEHALRGDALTTSGCNVSKIMVPVLQLMEKNHDTNNQECGWICITNLRQYVRDVKKLTTSSQMQATSHDACTIA